MITTLIVRATQWVCTKMLTISMVTMTEKVFLMKVTNYWVIVILILSICWMMTCLKIRTRCVLWMSRICWRLWFPQKNLASRTIKIWMISFIRPDRCLAENTRKSKWLICMSKSYEASSMQDWRHTGRANSTDELLKSFLTKIMFEIILKMSNTEDMKYFEGSWGQLNSKQSLVFCT